MQAFYEAFSGLNTILAVVNCYSYLQSQETQAQHKLYHMKLFSFLLLLFSHCLLFAQEGEAEGIATRNMKRVTWRKDTVLHFTVCDHHGSRGDFSRKIRLHIMFTHSVAAVEILDEAIIRQKYYYFDKGRVIMSEYETAEGDIVVNYYQKPLTNDCLYNVEGRFIFALYDLFKALSF